MDNAPTAALRHERDGGAAHEMCSPNIDCEGASPRLLINLDDRTSGFVGGGAVDKHPRDTESFDCLLNGAGDVTLARNIDPRRDAVPASRSYPFGCGFGCGLIDVKGGNFGTSMRKRQRDSLANTMAPTCDERHLPVEPESIHLHDPPPATGRSPASRVWVYTVDARRPSPLGALGPFWTS